MIAKYAFEGKMKDCQISKLLISKTGHRSTHYKNIIGTLRVLCADKNYQSMDDVIQNGIDRVEMDFMQTYPGTTRWSNAHHVKLKLSTQVSQQTQILVYAVVPSPCYNKYTSSTQISRRIYCQNTNGIPRTSLNSTLNFLSTKRL